MKTTIQFLKLACMALVLLSLQACPIGLDFPLEEAGRSELDRSLAGTWHVVNKDDPEIISARIDKRDRSTYNITVIEKGDMYSLEGNQFTAWNYTMDGYNFLIAQCTEDTKHYHYAYKITDGELTTWDFSLLVGGVDSLTSTAAFQKEVKASMAFEDFLSNETHWIRQ